MKTSGGTATRIGYKLFRVRRDNTLGTLFINRRQRLEVGETYQAEDHPTPGYAHRPGWHICSEKSAPHLSTKGRKWFLVEFSGYRNHPRPECQGGLCFTADRLTISPEHQAHIAEAVFEQVNIFYYG